MAESPTLTIGRFLCHHSSCPDHGERGHGNVRFRGHGGRERLIRMASCRTRGRSYSERKGTAFGRSPLPPEKAISVLDHIREGNGIRATGRPTGVSRDTTSRHVVLAGDRSELHHDGLVAPSPSGPRGPVRRGVELRRQGGGGLRPRRPRR